MNKKRLLVCALAFSTVGVLSTIDTTGVLPFSAQTVQADTQTLTPTAILFFRMMQKYLIDGRELLIFLLLGLQKLLQNYLISKNPIVTI